VWNATAIGRGWAGWKDWSLKPEKLVEQILFAADGTVANVIWIALGTNDYGVNLQAPALVQAQVARVLKMIRSVLPNAIIYVQTPLIRSSEAANGLGFTLGNYRTAIAQGVIDSGVSATTISGAGILTTGDLQDGVHPTSTGHAKWAISMQTSITQTVYPQKYTAGVFSTANYFSSALGVGQADLGIGKTLIVCWYQNSGATTGRVLTGYYDSGGFGTGTGWLIFLDTASNTVNFLTRPSGFVPMGATGVGWHCLALTYTTATTCRYSLDGGAVLSSAPGYTTAASNCLITIGAVAAGGAASTNEEVSGFAVLDYQLTDAELLAASTFGKDRGSLTLAQNAISGGRFIWTAGNYNPTLASQLSLGAFPVTLVRNGAISRDLKA
jgi:lysophospholipase L1-like esterase